jgi:hypothetical protein
MTRWLLAGWLAAFAGDIVTTDVGLGQGQREAVLPTQNRLIIDSVLGAEGLGAYWVYRHVKPNHPLMAKVLYGVVVGAHGSASLWNLRRH